MKQNFVVFIVFLIAGIALVSCSPSADLSADQDGTTQTDLLIAEGRLLPVRFVDVSFSVAGQIEEVRAADGDWVRRGQVLAILQDVPEFHEALARAQQEQLLARQELDDYLASADVNLSRGKLDVITARSRYNTARDNLLAGRSTERQARLDEAEALLKLVEQDLLLLEENNGLLPATLEVFQARLAAADTAVGTARSAVDALKLRAPLTGSAADVSVRPGQKIAAGEVALAVADFSQWVVETDSLTEIEVVHVKPDQQVEVVLDALPDLTLTGSVTAINSRFEEKRGDITYTATVKLNQSDSRMRWGMTAAIFFLP